MNANVLYGLIEAANTYKDVDPIASAEILRATRKIMSEMEDGLYREAAKDD